MVPFTGDGTCLEQNPCHLQPSCITMSNQRSSSVLAHQSLDSHQSSVSDVPILVRHELHDSGLSSQICYRPSQYSAR